MLLLYRIYTFLSSISGIVQFSEYDGLHKCQMFHTSGMFQTFQTTQPPGFSTVVPIFQRQKVDHRPPILSRRKVDSQSGRFSSAQKQAKEQPSKPAQSQMAGSFSGAVRRIKPPTEAVRRHPAMQQSFTFMRYPRASWQRHERDSAPYRRLLRRPAYTDSGRQQQ